MFVDCGTMWPVITYRNDICHCEEGSETSTDFCRETRSFALTSLPNVCEYGHPGSYINDTDSQ